MKHILFPAWMLMLLLVDQRPVDSKAILPQLTDRCPSGYVPVGQGNCAYVGLLPGRDLKPQVDGRCNTGWESAGGGYCRELR